MSEMNERKTTVQVGITRTLNTAKYENLQISVNTTDEITWSTVEERSKKIDNVVLLLNKKYQDTQRAVLGELGVSEKAAWMKGPPAKVPPKNDLGDLLD